MKKWMRILGYFAGAIFIIFILVVVLIVKSLPSPAQIGQKFFSASQAKPQAQTTTTISKNSNDGASTIESAQQAQNTDQRLQRDENGNYTLKNSNNVMIMQDLFAEGRPASDVCRFLRNADQSKINGYTVEEFDDRFEKSGLTDEKDPVVQSMKPILRLLFQMPTIQKLIEMASTAAKENDQSFKTKADFYKMAYQMSVEVTQNIPKFESISDKTYFLYMMARATNLRPDLATDPSAIEYCTSIENAINTNSDFPIDLQKREFERFLAYTKLTPAEVGYDPNYKTQLKMEWNSSSVRLKGGWMESLFTSARTK